MKEFDKEELAHYHGKNGVNAYIAYKGSVYDVSKSFFWKHGNHEFRHHAGQDLTDSLSQAPHGDSLLEKFPIVGRQRILSHRGQGDEDQEP